MLVLKRKELEAIRVGEVKVIVVEIAGDTVKLGIEAPLEVPVHREEIYQAIRRKGADDGRCETQQ